MNKQLRFLIIKYTLYTLLLFALYVLQTTPGLFALFGGKPFLLLPAVVCIAMEEHEYAGGLLGALAGMLCDLSSNTYFGFYGIMLLLIGTGIGLLCEYLVQRSLYSAILLSGGFFLFLSAFNYFFQYGLWDYPRAETLWINQILPSGLLTLPAVVVLYVLVKNINTGFAKHVEA